MLLSIIDTRGLLWRRCSEPPHNGKWVWPIRVEREMGAPTCIHRLKAYLTYLHTFMTCSCGFFFKLMHNLVVLVSLGLTKLGRIQTILQHAPPQPPRICSHYKGRLLLNLSLLKLNPSDFIFYYFHWFLYENLSLCWLLLLLFLFCFVCLFLIFNSRPISD